MLSNIKRILNFDWANAPSTDLKISANEACAILLVEVARADFHHSDVEKQEVKRLLQSHLDLPTDELEELIKHSESEGVHTTSLHPFTTIINDHYDHQKKVELIRLMWQVAFADGEIDKYEDSVIRKVADLLYVSHSDFIKAKLDSRKVL